MIDSSLFVEAPRPERLRRGRIDARFPDLERSVERIVRTHLTPLGIVGLFDGDDDCPAHLGPALLKRMQAIRPAIPISTVLAKREFEAWFLAAASSLAGRRGLSASLAAPADPEGIRDCKGWLSRNMPKGRRYSETADQAALTSLFSMQGARQLAPSFDKCFREIERLLLVLRSSP